MKALAAMVSPVAVTATAVIVAAGCDAGERQASAWASRDSAGVTIVESAGPEWTTAAPWRIDPEPVLDIGSADGEEPYLFDWVETAVRRSDGTIVIADAGSGQLRFFDSGGRFLKAAGGRGGGPGEFGNSSVHIWETASGNLVAEDAGNRRVHVFDFTGRLLQTVNLVAPGTGGNPSLEGVLADGSWLVQTVSSGPPDSRGLVPSQTAYHRFGPDGRFLGRLANLAAPSLIGGATAQGRAFFQIPFSGSPFAVTAGSDILLSAGDGNRLDRVDSTGRRLASYRWNAPRRRTADTFEAFIRDELGGADSTWRRTLESYHKAARPHLPEHVPGPIRMVVDADGNAWLQRYYLSSETVRQNDIIAPDGRWLGTITLPAGYWLLQAGSDFILVWMRDDLGVEHVLMHRLERGAVRNP